MDALMPPEFWASFARAVSLSVCAVVLSRSLLPALASWRSSSFRLGMLWLVIMAPFLMPPLLTAYGYTKVFLHLNRHPFLEELAYDLLLFFRVFPLTLLVGHCLPRRLSREGFFVWRTMGDRGSDGFWRFRWCHWEPVHVVGGLLVFLYVFHEFEMASLLQRPAWTVAIFDAQAQGYALSATWRRLWLLALMQAAVVIWALGLVHRRDDLAFSLSGSESGSHGLLKLTICAGLGTLVMVLIPLGIIALDGLKGFGRLPQAFSLQGEMRQSLTVAFVAATLAHLAARQLARDRMPRTLVLAALLPGLLGTLLLSLSLHGLIQWRVLEGLRDRPLALVAGLVFLILPPVTLLVFLARRREFSEAGWLVTLSNAKPLRWAYLRGPHLGIWGCGFYLAYFEVTASAILAPASMTPVMVRLYNLMHYGRDTMLSAYVLVVVGVPLVLLALAVLVGRGLTSLRG